MGELVVVVVGGLIVAAITGVFVSCRGLLVKAAVNLRDRWKARIKIKRRFKKLSPRQQKFLVDLAERHEGSAPIPDRVHRQQWFEELVEWNYLEYVNPIVFPFDGTSTYQITTNGMKQIKRSRSRIGG